MEPIGKAMLRGTYQQMAHKIWQHKLLRAEVVKYVLRSIAAECSSLCSTKNQSMARQSNSQDMMNFDFESLCLEWKNKAPLFYSFLMSCALSGRRKDVKTVSWLPSVAMAGAVLLRERSRGMDAVQLLVTVLIRSSANQVLFLIAIESANILCLYHPTSGLRQILHFDWLCY